MTHAFATAAANSAAEFVDVQWRLHEKERKKMDDFNSILSCCFVPARSPCLLINE